ncbi:MAG: phosphoribosylaminoimidazolecarboxamide formyltransferase [Clostridia bacterium]|nr:phosphoribosylaminoimidazolecarboxamide formyltransferase [Clostridia bacterium]
MSEIILKYGCNPNQTDAKIETEGEMPLKVLCGRPGYINFLDALNGWQLVSDIKRATGLPAATSFKHVSPAGAAVGLPLDDAARRACFINPKVELSPLACAYARARGADRMSSFGDFIALSDVCDEATARIISPEVSDGVIAPGYDAAALEILSKKRRGAYNVIQIDPDYIPAETEKKTCFGITFTQRRNDCVIDESLLRNIPTQNKELPQSAARDLLISLITLKYTQSNSVCYAFGGQAIGVGAGQQSRIHCTRLAGDKSRIWHLRRHPKTLSLEFLPDIPRPERDNAIDLYLSNDCEKILDDWQSVFAVRPDIITPDEKRQYLSSISGVSLGSDAFFPFGDNIETARQNGVSYVAQPGGSIRDDNVIAVCDKYGMVMAFTGLRLFHH